MRRATVIYGMQPRKPQSPLRRLASTIIVRLIREDTVFDKSPKVHVVGGFDQ